MTSTKPYSIAKRVVWEAYQLVKANRGAAGVDDETIAMYEQNLSGNLYKLWNRMSSGSYFPPPVKQVEIPKAKGGTRKLGIPTVSDRVAQSVVKLTIEPTLDPIFHDDSYGYRPGKSAKQAIAVTRKRCWKYDWVVEFDIKAAFDQIDHALLMKAVRRHIKESWILLYVERWLTAPFETADGASLPRTQGTPQGGVVSPILMNLFMHYTFDSWMQRTWPQSPFARYADDAVVHCRSLAQAEAVMRAIATRLEECGLTMHPEKSKIVYCKDSARTGTYPNVQFTFLGFTFRPRKALSKYQRRFTGFLPAVSSDALKRMRQKVRSWRIHRRTSATLDELAQQCNTTIQGWWNYYGAFYRTAMHNLFDYVDRRLEQWARRKYKRMRQSDRRSQEWLRKMRAIYPRLFVHWRVAGVQAG
ncbi:group II intron reverse transcriptase/maturase [Cupriavidus sp. TA19]|uniref:group II intron reverse transcriptase/maturase n=1 Tax=Cupriavidus sp. TA19 TaxID=701108 RepID=UPI002729430D|nr:group II intron reverse transcriptase/maturase [Cupriavidus sp. TA19]GLC97780.1 group II intron reverse transcriptase/maturase [Cupriavidus sp. TA19]